MSALWALRMSAWLAVASPPQPPTTVRVAAIVYPGGEPASFGCKGDLCAFDLLIREAHGAGAEIVVTPEYATPQRVSEPRLRIGGRPSESTAPLQAHFAALADSLDLYLAVDLETEDTEGNAFNSLVVFDPRGTIAARHDKFELFEGERQALTAGQPSTVFETPFGRIALLICADLYGEPALHQELTEGVSIVLVSAAWTVPVATRWQAAFARDWGVFVVAANASAGSGRGGGVFDPRGSSVATARIRPEILIADVSLASIADPAGSKGSQ